MFIEIRLENREEHHNKFYEMKLNECTDNKTRVEIFSGRIRVTRIDQSKQKSIPEDGWSTWGEGYSWFVQQFKKKVGVNKKYDLRILKTDSPELDEEITTINEQCGAQERLKQESFAEYLTTHWW